MTRIELFNEIQLSRDYDEDRRTGVNLRNTIDFDRKQVFVEFQETKTRLDWFFNFLILPVPVFFNGHVIITCLGFYLQALAAYRMITENQKLKFFYDYSWIFAGWSQGAATCALTALLMLKRKKLSGRYIGYGCPAFLFGKKSVEYLRLAFKTAESYLYHGDWIRFLVPFCGRFSSEDVTPFKQPANLDARHRVYGKCYYTNSADI